MTEQASILLLHGSDEFAIQAHIDRLCAALGDPASAEMNIARFDGRLGLEAEAFNNAASAAPFLAPGRLVTLAHPGAAFGTPDGRKKFIAQMEGLPPTTTLVLAEYEECKPNYWLMKWAARAGPRARVHVYNLPKPWQMPRWLESEARKLGGAIDPNAANRLAEMVGQDPRVADQELIKLLTYVNHERPISLLDVEKVSIVSAQGTIFDLVDALGSGDGRRAQQVLHQHLEGGDAFELWGMILRQFRLLLQARELLDSNASVGEVKETLGLHEYVAGKLCTQAKGFSLETLEAIHHKLLEIDEGAKTGQMPLDAALDILVVQLTRK